MSETPSRRALVPDAEALLAEAAAADDAARLRLLEELYEGLEEELDAGEAPPTGL
ncbi:MAG TPA: hypothetical protein VHK89_08355 [Actinomycetota bacterium]|jgi:hypothetical protein|nr:hypothetical protein [Actinomycetota bacterium]